MKKLFEKLREFFPTIDVKRSIRRLSKGMQEAGGVLAGDLQQAGADGAG